MQRPAILLALLVGACAAPGDNVNELPHLARHGRATQLIVDGSPFLILGGELGNSTASDTSYLAPFWPLFDSLHLNTILAPVYWELIEPVEGEFDFSSVDGLLRQARRHDKRLVLLWFGSWKNSMSSYAPAWVKRDQARFPRAQMPDGRGMEMLASWSSANCDADAAAFRALMDHLRQEDGHLHTVIMVQVENEIGMIPNARDHSPHADSLFVASGLRSEEQFMARDYAKCVEVVASAGKRAYPLPMFVNAALVRPGRKPGEYPSAGPLPHLMEIWRAGAPSIDFLAPDIYFPNFVEWARAYALPGNALFIPEAGRAPEATPVNGMFAIGALDAMGFSPFSIENYRATDRLGEAYAILEQLTPLILEHQGDSSMTGVRPPVNFDGVVDTMPQDVRLGGYTLHVSFRDPWRPAADQKIESHGGLIIQHGPDEYIIAGRGLTVTFSVDSAIAGIESIHEGTYVSGRWVPGRLLNGDESHQGRHLRIPSDQFGIQRVKLYRYH